MYYPNSVSTKELSDRVHAYTKRIKRYGNSYANECLFESIKEILLEFAYYVPQQKLGLAEEDASEFVLYTVEYLEQILLAYRDEANDFYAYFTAVLDNKVKTFYRNKRRVERKEQSAVAAQCPTEVRLFPTITDGLIVSDGVASAGGSKLARALRYLALKSKTTQKRLFVFLLSISPFLSFVSMENFCSLLEIDFKQTCNICDLLGKVCPELTGPLKEVTAMRNYYFTRSLELEKEIYRNRYFCDYNKVNKDLEKLQRARHMLKHKNEQLDNMTLHASYDDVGKILGLPKSTVGGCIFYAKNLLSWCSGHSSMVPSTYLLGINEDLINSIVSGSWESESVKITKKSILHPEKAYKVNFSLNV